MFRESLLETSAATLAQRGWATMMSFGLEMAAIAAVLVVPLFITQTIPLINNERLITPPLAAPRMPKITTEIFTNGGEGSGTGALVEPSQIPTTIAKGPDPKALGGGNEVVPCTFCVDGGIGDPASTSAALTRILTATAPTVPSTAVHPVQKMIHISRIDPGMLISSVEPKYPPLARGTRVQGDVLLAAVIGKDGRIENLRVVSGHPLLVGAAMNAVRQWRYRPTMLNGQPVEVDTTISVRFTLRQD